MRFFYLLVMCVCIATLWPSHSEAQMFGPKNLEECMLNKMKGQTSNMVGVARTACLKLFPQEILLSDQQVVSKWCDTNDESISACVTAMADYKITRAEAVFTRAKCNSPEASFFLPDFKASTTPPLFGSTYKFKVDKARLYQCARFDFYGHRKP